MRPRHPGALAVALGDLADPGDFRRIEATAAGSGWISFADIVGDGTKIEAMLARSAARNAGRRELAGSFTGLRIAGPAIDLAVSLYLATGWATPLPAQGLLLRPDDAGLIRGVTLRDATIAAAPDTAPDEPGIVRLRDQASVVVYLAGELRALLTPAFAVLAARTPYGMRGLWSAAADQVAGIAVRRARARGRDADGAWRAGEAIIDALAAVEPWVRMRPRLFLVGWPGAGGKAAMAVKGTCCLAFRTSDHADDRRYCSNCPLLGDAARKPRAAHMLAQEFARLQGDRIS